MTILPELLPGASQIHRLLSIQGVIGEIKEQFSDIEDDDNIARIFSMILVCIIWYSMAITWRWSLKATLWLWLPLALLLYAPTRNENLTKIRSSAITQVYIGKILLFLIILIMLWLSTNYFTIETINSWAALIGDAIPKWLGKLQEIIIPPTGLLELILWLFCFLGFIVWIYSDHVNRQNSEILTNPNAVYDLYDEPRQAFLNHSRRLTRLYTFLVISFIILGYAFILHIGKVYYLPELSRVIPQWLISYL